MADTKISGLPSASPPLVGDEQVPIVQSNVTKKVTVSDLTNGRDVNGLSFTGGYVKISGNTLSTTGTDRNLVIDPVGSGAVTLHGEGSNWTAGYQALEWASTSGLSLMSAGNDSHVMTNAYYNSGYRYKTAGDPATDYVQTSGLHIFKYATTSLTAGDPITWVEAFRVNTSGNIVPSQAKGIDFSNNSTLPGKTSTLLSWYEEGTFTVTATPDTGSITLDIGDAYYTRVGRIVTVTGYVQVGSVSSPTGNVYFGNLPFTSANNANGGSIGRIASWGSLTGVIPTIAVQSNQSFFYIFLIDQASGTSIGAASKFQTASSFGFSITYTI